uniref:Uncharacterized protein n=1 Tax=Araucaria cunninghamii TaxID=56994 RepID=A0A0D6QWY7_ARACU
MSRFFVMGKLTCFSIFARRNRVKHECASSVETLHSIEPCKDEQDSNVPELSTTVKELMGQKDSVTVKTGTDIVATEDCSSGSVVDPQQPHSMNGFAKTQSNGFGADSDFSFCPQIGKLCNETPVETAYEGGDEQEVLSSSRELSDHECQRNMDNAVSSRTSKNLNGSSSHKLELFDNSAEVIFEINHKCEKPLYNEKMQKGYLSDPGSYKMGYLHSAFTSPVFQQSSSGHKCESGGSPDIHSTPLPPSNSQSFEDLQLLASSQRGLQGNQSSPMSADKVMLKRRSSSNVLSSRRRKSWWRIFLWSHRNLHKGVQIQQGDLLRESEEVDQAINRKEGYTSDTLDECNTLYQTKQGKDLGKLKSLEENCMLNVLSDEQQASEVHGSKKIGFNQLSRVASSRSYSQWVAFPAEQSNMRRVEEWVSSIDQGAFSLDNRDASEENTTGKDEGIVGGNTIVELPETFEKSDTSIWGGNLPNEVLQANNAIQSLNAFSTVAHISGIGLSVIPALASFTSLRMINLSGNNIVRITPGSLPRTLQTLDLSRNKITAIEGLRELTRLRVLNLSYNRISRIGHGVATCTSIKELYLAGNKISDVEGLHRLLKLTVLDVSFNKITTLKALGQLAANYSSLLALNLLGNPVHTNVGDEQIRKSILSLLHHLAYLNKQPIKTVSAREAVTDSVARAALGNGGRNSRNKISRRGSNVPSVHRSATHSRRGSRGNEGGDRVQGRQSRHSRDKGKSKQEHALSRRAAYASSSHHQKLNSNVPLARKVSMHISISEGNLQDFEHEKSPFHQGITLN